jgi:hypothetical protein
LNITRSCRLSPLALVLLAWLAWLVSESTAHAFPGFARRYSPTTSVFTFMPCAGCHDPFPKLTPFGRRFKENGFRVDGDRFSWKDTLKAYPIAVRNTAYRTGIGEGAGSTFGIIKPISAGALGSRVSYWVDQPFLVNDNGVKRLDVDYAWVGAYDLARSARPGLVNVRGGAFELDLPFSQARTHNLFGYDPYFLNGGDGDWSLAAPQRGFEVSGRPWDSGRYSVAVVDTVRRSEPKGTRFDPDVYARFAVDVATTNRFGVFLYDGHDELATGDGSASPSAVSTREHTRFGADFDMRFASAGATLYGLYLWGEDRGVDVSHANGGFVQFEKQTTDWLLLTSRYTHVSEGSSHDSLALGANAWFLERFRITFEYRFQSGSAPNNGILAVDFVL